MLGDKRRIFYAKKDILFLAHEPLLQKYRDLKSFLKKQKKAVVKKDTTRARLMMKKKPKITFDHLVKERYPTFVDAGRDMDDALCMVNLYASLPSGTVKV